MITHSPPLPLLIQQTKPPMIVNSTRETMSTHAFLLLIQSFRSTNGRPLFVCILLPSPTLTFSPSVFLANVLPPIGNSRRPEITQTNLVDIFLFHGDSRQMILHYPNVTNPSDQAGRITAQVNDSWWGTNGDAWDGTNTSYPFYWVIIRSDKTLDANAIAQATFTAVRM